MILLIKTIIVRVSAIVNIIYYIFSSFCNNFDNITTRLNPDCCGYSDAQTLYGTEIIDIICVILKTDPNKYSVAGAST